MEAVRPYFTKIAVDENIAEKDAHGSADDHPAFFGVMMVRGLIQYLNTYLTQWIGQRTIFDLRMEVYEHLQRLGAEVLRPEPHRPADHAGDERYRSLE